MDAKIAEIVSRMKQQRGPAYVTVQLSDMAELSALIAEQQAQSAAKLERFTRWLIVLTVVLIAASLLALVPPFAEMFNHVSK